MKLQRCKNTPVRIQRPSNSPSPNPLPLFFCVASLDACLRLSWTQEVLHFHRCGRIRRGVDVQFSLASHTLLHGGCGTICRCHDPVFWRGQTGAKDIHTSSSVQSPTLRIRTHASQFASTSSRQVDIHEFENVLREAAASANLLK